MTESEAKHLAESYRVAISQSRECRKKLEKAGFALHATDMAAPYAPMTFPHVQYIFKKIETKVIEV